MKESWIEESNKRRCLLCKLAYDAPTWKGTYGKHNLEAYKPLRKAQGTILLGIKTGINGLNKPLFDMLHFSIVSNAHLLEMGSAVQVGSAARPCHAMASSDAQMISLPAPSPLALSRGHLHSPNPTFPWESLCCAPHPTPNPPGRGPFPPVFFFISNLSHCTHSVTSGKKLSCVLVGSTPTPQSTCSSTANYWTDPANIFAGPWVAVCISKRCLNVTRNSLPTFFAIRYFGLQQFKWTAKHMPNPQFPDLRADNRLALRDGRRPSPGATT
ncbi:hypothetical protein K456DRAFT_42580 [Colletotrichum gloeosporioides 23]|nr:hypothetical protein K456DRAFT_42580 [Colletotrichum gloeosporioides 23]